MSVALDRTKKVKVGPVVTSPIGGRYHPVIIGHASATLDNMYPSRFLLGVGSGEAMSEAMFFPDGWPKWKERTERLAEAIVLMKKMWTCEHYFAFDGKYFPLKNFYLYTKPKADIPIYFSAIGKKATAWAGRYGDHLVTINPPDVCRDVIFPIFESAAKEAGKDPSKMEKMVEVPLYFGDKKRTIREIRDSGDAGVFADGAFDELDPRRIQEMARNVPDEKITTNIYIIESPDQLIDVIDGYWKVGSVHTELVTHTFTDRIRFIGEKVLPYFLNNDDYVR
jgi:coenzyme F420-dependent glucose-6-phosphate dehydrogenase